MSLTAFQDLMVTPHQTLRDVFVLLNKNLKGIVFVVDEHQVLLGSITDGDCRRAILEGKDLSEKAAKVMYPKPTVIKTPVDENEVQRLFRATRVRQIPIVDATGRIVDIRFVEDNTLLDLPEIRAVIMAGGFGKRLLPLTEKTPKPLLKVGNQTIIEGIIHNLRSQGITDITVSVGFEKNQIRDFLGDGSQWMVKISYLEENEPLGTLGPLGGLDLAQNQMALVVNGDLITEVDYVAMARFHTHHKADITVGVRKIGYEIPYGVINTLGENVVSLSEKPLVDFNINAGMYLFSTEAKKLIKPHTPLQATDFIRDVLNDKKLNIRAFSITEYWLDIGRPEELKLARAERIDKT